jgi:hypothetical protein
MSLVCVGSGQAAYVVTKMAAAVMERAMKAARIMKAGSRLEDTLY